MLIMNEIHSKKEKMKERSGGELLQRTVCSTGKDCLQWNVGKAVSEKLHPTMDEQAPGTQAEMV